MNGRLSGSRAVLDVFEKKGKPLPFEKYNHSLSIDSWAFHGQYLSTTSRLSLQ